MHFAIAAQVSVMARAPYSITKSGRSDCVPGGKLRANDALRCGIDIREPGAILVTNWIISGQCGSSAWAMLPEVQREICTMRTLIAFLSLIPLLACSAGQEDSDPEPGNNPQNK